MGAGKEGRFGCSASGWVGWVGAVRGGEGRGDGVRWGRAVCAGTRELSGELGPPAGAGRSPRGLNGCCTHGAHRCLPPPIPLKASPCGAATAAWHACRGLRRPRFSHRSMSAAVIPGMRVDANAATVSMCRCHIAWRMLHSCRTDPQPKTMMGCRMMAASPRRSSRPERAGRHQKRATRSPVSGWLGGRLGG